MVEIVLSICLIATPANCKDVALTYMAGSITPQQCMFRGQAEIAKYLQGHPKWRVKKWTCGRPGQLAKA